MNNKAPLKVIIAAGLVFLTASVIAKEKGWYTVGTTDHGQTIFSIKLHSGQRTHNGDGQALTVVVGQVRDKKKDTGNFYKWYVTDEDCRNGYGELFILDIEGNYNSKAAFASGSKTASSSIAKFICAVTKNEKNKEKGESIHS